MNQLNQINHISHMNPSNLLAARGRQAGSTLIEVLIALLVFTIGLQGIASMQYQAVKDNFDSSQREHGIWAAEELINRIRANPEGREAGLYTKTDENPCNAGEPATFCADADGSPAPTCSAIEMAAFDIWQSICTTPDSSRAQGAGNLLSQKLTISCVGTCSTNSEISLSLEWQSKAVADDTAIDDGDNSLKTQQFTQIFQP